MSIFDLHRDVLADYRDFVRSFLVIADEKARRFVDKALEEEARLWPDFLAQVSPSYATGLTVMELARHGAITAETAEVFQRPDGSPFTLYRHPEEAIRRALTGQSFIVTSGPVQARAFATSCPSWIASSASRTPKIAWLRWWSIR